MAQKQIRILVIFFVATLLAKVYLRSASEYRQAIDLQSTGQVKSALYHYELALRWYLPLNPYSRKALQAVWDIGDRTEKEGDQALALEAYRAVRSATLGIRSFYTPYGRWLPRANEKIASIETSAQPKLAQERNPGTDEVLTEEQKGEEPGLEESGRSYSLMISKEEALKRLAMDRAPSVGWSVLTEIGFIGWVLCAVVLAFAMNSSPREKRGRKSLIWGSSLTVFFALWLVSMAHA